MSSVTTLPAMDSALNVSVSMPERTRLGRREVRGEETAAVSAIRSPRVSPGLGAWRLRVGQRRLPRNP